MYPTYIATEKGKTVIFICKFITNAEWSFMGNKVPPNSLTYVLNGSKGTLIRITDVQFHNAGKYTCVSELDYILFQDECELEVFGKCLILI